MESPSQETPAQGSREMAEYLKFVHSEPQLTVLTDHALAPEQAAVIFAHDPFNFRYKLGPIYDILRHEDPGGDSGDCCTPMAILISGGWGTGKTSAMKWLAGLLDEWNELRKQEDIGSGVSAYPLWFYPWKYDSKESVWRGLISEIIIKSTRKDSKLGRAIKATRRFGLFLGKGFFHPLASMKCKARLSPLGVGGEVELDMARVKEVLALYKGIMQPEKAYLNEFEATLKNWLEKTIKEKERMVVFIDDLDRCLPEVALEVLEALKLYLDIRGLIFVVGMDKDFVERIIVEHYRGLGLVRAHEQEQAGEEVDDGQQYGERTDEEKAKQYLSKMFQIEVELGPTQRQIEEFLDKQLTSIPYWGNHLSDEHRELFNWVIVKLAGNNPREIKRFLNSGLMVGVGSEKMGLQPEQNGLCFAQGLQSFFIRRILHKHYENVARRMDDADFQRFLSQMSQVVRAQPDEGENNLDERLDREFRRAEAYRDYLVLLHNENLKALMHIPFSPELVELTSQVHAPVEQLTRSTVPRRGEMGRIEHVPTDRAIIDQKIAREINKLSGDITLAECERVTHLDLSYSEIGSLESIGRLKRLESLALFGCSQLEGIGPLTALIHLQKLDLRETRVDNLKPLDKLVEMRELYLRGNPIENLDPLINLIRLQRADVIGMPVTNIQPLANLRELQYLDLTETQISDISELKSLTRLQTLCLCGTRVAKIDGLAPLTGLKYLDLSGLDISDATPLKVLADLHHLDLCKTRVTDLEPLKDLHSLRVLYLECTRIKDLTPLQNLTKLQKLRLAETKITDVTPLRSLTGLQELRLATTEIKDLEPLQGLTNLRVLYLEGTPVDDIRTLAALSNLQELHLADTQVTDLTPLQDLENLRRLDLAGTSVTPEEIEELKRARPQLRVHT